MRVVTSGLLGAICLILMGAVAGPARAESDAVCRQYAQAAVNAFEQVRSRGCPLSNARWQGNYDSHYGWCLQAPAEWVQLETRHRENHLRVCLGESKAVACNEYATLANSAQQSNLGGNCGFTEGRWHANFDDHLDWCLREPIEAANREIAIRHAMLGICGRQEPYVRCDAYARDAVAQGQEAAARNCGVSGPRWQAAYEDHLTWCVGQPAEVAASEAAARGGELSQCRTNNPMPGGGSTPAGESCAWSVTVTVGTCRNVDGTEASISFANISAAGCGGTPESALDRARASLASAICLTEGDSPAAGCCTYEQEVVQGCQC
jgi:hypothetical protein